MTHDELREVVKAALSKPLSNMYGGCFKPEGRDARGDCADGDCYCARVGGHCATAVLAAVRAALGEPDDAMIAAGWIDKEDVDPDDIWCAMLAASPLADPGARDDGEGVG